MKPKTGAEPWYRDGIRFQCQQTGACCTNHGDYSYVYVSRDEERSIATHLGQTLTAFRRQHTRLLDGHRILRNDQPTCRFLDGHRCSIYPVRPQQCQTWPFWPSTLASPTTWAADVASMCRGVGQGRLWSREEIEAVLKRSDRDD